MKTNFCVSILFLAFLTFSCSKEDDVYEPNHSESKLEIQNGIIKFDNKAQYLETIKLLNNMSSSELEQWELNNNFLNSMRRKYAEIENSENEIKSEIIPWKLIPDPVFATIVNTDGVYIVGDSIHVLKENQEMLVKDGDINKLELILESDSEVQLENVDYFDVINVNLNKQGMSVKKIGDHADEWVIKVQNPCGRSDLSTHLKAWRYASIFYSSVGIRMTGRKLDGGNWRNDRINYGKVTGEGWIEGYDPIGNPRFGSDRVNIPTQNDDGRDEKHISKTLYYWGGGLWDYHDVYIYATYQVNDYGCGDQYFIIKWHDDTTNELVYNTTGTIIGL